MAQSGMSSPAYAYAANNPLRYTDSTGLFLDYDRSDIVLTLALYDVWKNPKTGPKLRRMMADKRTASSFGGAMGVSLLSTAAVERGLRLGTRVAAIQVSVL